MKTSITKTKYIFTSLGITAIFMIWLFASIKIDNPIILPKISEVFSSLKAIITTKKSYEIILYTNLRVIISLFLGIVIGIFLGVITALAKPIYYFFMPFIKIMRVLPIASIILILLIIFGQKGYKELTFAPIFVSLLMIVPIVFEATYRGIISIDRDLVDVAKLDTKNKITLVFNSYIPLARNNIITSIYQSIGLSIKVMVMAEYLSQTQLSIGKALLDSKTYLEYDKVFAWTIILIIICFLVELVSSLILKLKEENN